MKSFHMIARLLSALRGLQWRILAISSRSGVKISSDEREWRVNHHSRVGRRLELCTLPVGSRLVPGQATC